mmetsp:Transcript_92028/g.269248  ORF Transcript_92028/g.269248 Transcript_92028/m.269248 type:complete len:279 (+) Transcript_92028:922-1758(+)
MVMRTCCSLDFTKATSSASFSVEETAETTSQSTPISMFIMVIAASMTKKKNTKARNMYSSVRVSMTTSRSSKKTPCIAKVYIDCPTLWKYGDNASCSSANWVKNIAKMYTKNSRSIKVNTTDLVALAMPLTRIISSGTARSKRTMRAMRERRSSLAMRKMEALPMPAPASLDVNFTTNDITQVSMTIMKTSNESKANQASFNPLSFLLKAKKRMNHSVKKYAQKRFSARMNPAPESNRASAVLWSVSMAIQIAFSEITVRVAYSNKGDLAILCGRPEV